MNSALRDHYNAAGNDLANIQLAYRLDLSRPIDNLHHLHFADFLVLFGVYLFNQKQSKKFGGIS